MRKIFVLTAVMAFAVVPFIFAAPPKGGGHGNPEMGGRGMMMDQGVMRFLDELNLTEEQKSKLREVHSGNKRDIMNLRHEIQLAVFDMQEEYKKDKSDAVKINSFIDKISEAQKKMMKIRSAQMLEMKAVLTPEQFKKLVAKMDKVKAKVKKGFFEKLMKKDK